jgi:predicted trehalose synthase
MTRQNSAASEAEAAAQAQLKEIAEELKAIEKRLREIHKSLAPPKTARSGAAESEADNDISTEIRSVIECVLTDSLGPATRDLRAAARYGTKGSPNV